jgi:transcriptional regulator with PAS, ATPase and Fis domain
MIDAVAPGSISVLVLGETGVGKEVYATTIHQRSPRASKPFLCLNCAALPETMLEAELFGYERGAFTGAMHAKPGLFESADKGTVFLDEIGEMSLPTQAKLLRVLESGETMRLGALRPQRVDVRLVSATNNDLPERVEAGTFRRDLYFRLNGISVRLPPLRERPEDVVALARRFLHANAKKLGRPVPAIARAAVAVLEAHAWPGNVRELKNVIERAVLLSGGQTIEPAHLGMPEPPAAKPSGKQQVRALRQDVDSFERERILAALERCGGNQTLAAQALGIGRSTLLSKLDEYGLPRPRKGRAPA